MLSLLCLGRGFGQIMLQENASSGLFIFLGLFCGSSWAAAMALLGNVAGTLSAWVAGFDKRHIMQGLYGFNGALVGLGVWALMELNGLSVGLAVAGAVASTFIARAFMLVRGLPGFTAPFILSVWLLLAIAPLFGGGLLQSSSPLPSAGGVDWLQACFLNFGQVMFQGNTLAAGCLFLLALLDNSGRVAVYALGGSLLSIVAAYLFQADFSAINAGLMGYNGVLCAIALAGKGIKPACWAVFSVLISVGLQMAGMRYGVVTLTAPFVLSAWIVLFLTRRFEKP